MVAIAVLACVMGYYIKNKFFKDDEDKEEKEKNEQKKTADMRMPGPKANKPWLNQGKNLYNNLYIVISIIIRISARNRKNLEIKFRVALPLELPNWKITYMIHVT